MRRTVLLDAPLPPPQALMSIVKLIASANPAMTLLRRVARGMDRCAVTLTPYRVMTAEVP
ncbi:hypothetical protein KZZ52_18030 [Dactylosporangium sp. AC04546]|uniref:hypothetical protein n=1 Tax=Dactylosporangium sp. AC04546 TaxID=2862460 RepID=UPI001EDCCD3B|nr:hypothetical protein [Dactylosporangium sp. AC04546]WVK87200.1 hypothetical protein KZZ52_18030 [Dactylosporangium sp. AC04546]